MVYNSNTGLLLMYKFIIKFFIIFISLISLMFFSLIYFQADKERKEHQKMEQFIEGDNFLEGFDLRHHHKPPHPPKPTEPAGPPMSIPIIFILGISSVFVLIILDHINRTYVKPLQDIQNNVDKIKNGSLNVDFETKSKDKHIVDTFTTMNEMVQGLKQREKLQDNYIRNLIHDLRAPVIAQERAMEILSDEMKDNELVEGMTKNNDAYLKMINSLIESFSHEDIKIEKMDFDFSKLADSVVEALKPMAKAKNIELRTAIQDKLTVRADYLSFNRIILNLVSNAIENIDNNKTVTIEAKQNPQTTIITIVDNGKGLKEQDKDNLFKNHLKENLSEKKSISGLGLSIVYDLVVQNGGSIRVESEEDKYTKFIIELANEDKNA